MRDLNDLFFFAEVVEHGGFAPAGRALGIPKSKLSRRVAALEERLGVRLIQRSTRRFSVTEIGQEYYRHCRAMLVEADAAEELIARNQVEPQGTIRMSCASAVLYTMMGDMVARFMAQCPRIKVQLEVTNRAVDLIREGYDLALRVRFPPLEDSDLVMKVLAISTQRLVASPRLLAAARCRRCRASCRTGRRCCSATCIRRRSGTSGGRMMVAMSRWSGTSRACSPTTWWR